MPAVFTIWGQLLPTGPDILARDGRRWSYDPQELAAVFATDPVPLALDYEHGQDLQASKGEEAPAAGWMTDMAAHDGALWVKLELTAKAAARVQEREYRYLSASMRHTPERRITSIAGAALVNRPALPVLPLDPAMTDLPISPVALAQRAECYRNEQAALGRMMTISEAVMSVQERHRGMSVRARPNS